MTEKAYHQPNGLDLNLHLPTAQLNQSQLQSCISYTPPNGLPGINQPSNNVCDATCTAQGAYRYQHVQVQPPSSSNLYPSNANSYCDQLDSWITESRFIADIEKGLKFPEKIESIEITSKDLSPASCCSNVELFLPDIYKSGSSLNKTAESQWYCGSGLGNQKFSEYPSCAQVSANNQMMVADKTVRYCSIQKGELDNCNKSYFNSISYTADYSFYNKQFAADKMYVPQDFGAAETFYENKLLDNCDMQQYFCPSQVNCSEIPFQSPEQRTEVSNDESDIVVEESDEEVTDYSEDQEKRFEYNATCVICSVLYIPHGSQFYFLTAESPLTMSSQQPVYLKLREFLGELALTRIHLCSQCLGLINTIDHLEFKLDGCKRELYAKLKGGCKEAGKTKTKKEKTAMHFRCKLCRKVFSLRKICKQHLRKHKLKNRYLCEICGQRYTKITDFRLHTKSHKGSTFVRKLKPFVCKLCNKTFRTNSNLKEHHNYCSGLLPFVCKHISCGKKFPTITKLKSHVKLKHDKKFSSICSICNIGFIKMSSYKAHMISHSTEKKYNCTQCDKSYKTLSNLNFHMKYHNDRLPFTCDICDKGFMRKEYLEAHVNGHSGVKNFGCHVCEKKFVSQKNLDSHLKYHDGTAKKKSCGICGKVLTTGFEEHVRTHNNLKEFECKECMKRFNTKGALIKHKKNKHLNQSERSKNEIIK